MPAGVGAHGLDGEAAGAPAAVADGGSALQAAVDDGKVGFLEGWLTISLRGCLVVGW